MSPRFCAYFTRHMPVELRDRLHAVVEQRNEEAGRRVATLEDIVNEALAIGVNRLEREG